MGKTSLIKAVLARSRLRAGGFYTEEVRESGRRQGFRLVTLDGQQGILAHVSLASPYRVGQYGVDIISLEEIGVAAVTRAVREKSLAVVDEIGKMELFSAAFQEAVQAALAGQLLGTIMQAFHPFADRVKKAPGVRVLTLTRENRPEVEGIVTRWLEERG